MKSAALEKYTVGDVLAYRDTPQLYHTVSDTATVEDALAAMYVHGIVSLPVLRNSGADQAFVDIVSVYDLRDYITSSPTLKEEVDFQLLSGRASGNLTVLQDTVSQVVQSRKHASQEISAHAPLEELVRLFSKLGQHRVLVSDAIDHRTTEPTTTPQVPGANDKGGRQRGISIDSGMSSMSYNSSHSEIVCGLTQYDVVRFIQHHNHELGRTLDTCIEDIAKIHAPLQPSAPHHLPHLTVRDTALDALRLLRDTKCSALPVVDSDGRLITEIAGANLRGLTTGSIGLLGKPVLAYMFGLGLPITNPYIVHRNFTLSQVMAGLLQMNCRRAWLVDDDERPIAIVSLTDVLNHFL
ncbi:hypothetical protein GGF46_004149 [Coemansia sp. RSA 552]|nr:hypothetical protein GGF46_004149 [Coemansia sp. RSA 552]